MSGIELGGPPPVGYDDPASILWHDAENGLALILASGTLIVRLEPQKVARDSSTRMWVEVPDDVRDTLVRLVRKS